MGFWEGLKIEYQGMSIVYNGVNKGHSRVREVWEKWDLGRGNGNGISEDEH